jgi:hypothetical protein
MGVIAGISLAVFWANRSSTGLSMVGPAMGALIFGLPVLLVLFGLLVIGIHEWGHCWFLRRFGMQVDAVQIIHLRFENRDGGWVGVPHLERELLGMVHFDDSTLTRGQARWVYLGGALANLGLAASLSPFVFLHVLDQLVVILVGANVGVAMTNLIPFRTRTGYRSDGAQVLATFR